MIQRLVVYATLGTLCSALGYAWDSAQFWCFLGLFWAVDVLGRHQGYEQAEQDFAELLDQAVENLKAANDQLVQARDTIIKLEKNNK